jgi:hypothetical protein
MYKKSELVKVTWSNFNKYTEKIYTEVQKYLKDNNLEVNIVAPILRGGGILGIQLALKFKVIRILPYQYKYLHKNNNTEIIKVYTSNFKNLVKFNNKKPVILVVEGNHSTGTIAKQVVSDIKKEFPNSRILYVSLAKDYAYKDVVDVDFDSYGFLTNENRKLSKSECYKLKIKQNKVYIFPWESFEEELAGLNQTEFKYNNQEDFN